MPEKSLTTLLGIQGYEVATVERVSDSKEGSIVRISLLRTREGHVCGKCGQVLAWGL